MTAIKRFREALQIQQVNDEIIDQLFEGYEKISDKAPKYQKAAFFAQAIERMETLLEDSITHEIRDACACSKGGWRLKAMQKIARELEGEPLETKIAAIGQVTHMGNPVLNQDGTICAGIGIEGGFRCPCPVFEGSGWEARVSKTYCYCCAGHFRHHYQVALGLKLKTIAVVSSALESEGQDPCRFVFEITSEKGK